MKSETRDNLNFATTIGSFLCGAIVVITIPLAIHAYNSDRSAQTSELTAHSDKNVSDLKQAITESYETKESHNLDIENIKLWNKSLQDGQVSLATQMKNNNDEAVKNNNDIKLSIQRLTDANPIIKQP